MSDLKEYICNGVLHTDESGINWRELPYLEAMYFPEPGYIKVGTSYREVYDYYRDLTGVDTASGKVECDPDTIIYFRPQDYNDSKKELESDWYKEKVEAAYEKFGGRDPKMRKFWQHLKSIKKEEPNYRDDYSTEMIEEVLGNIACSGCLDLDIRSLLNVVQKFNGTFD